MHFTVMVLTDGTKDVVDLLAPYDENLEMEPYIGRTKSELIEEAKIRADGIRKRIAEKEAAGEKYSTTVWEDGLLAAKTDEEFYEAFKWTDGLYDEDGNELSTYNPNSKWDWYQIGGRWEGLIRAKRGINAKSPSLLATRSGYTPPPKGHYDHAMIKDILFDEDLEERKKAERFWEVVIEDSPLKKGESEEDYRTFYSKEYFLKEYETKENYVKSTCALTTYAVITPDGEWYDKDNFEKIQDPSIENKALDWNLNFKKRFIDPYAPTTVVTIVDCHI